MEVERWVVMGVIGALCVTMLHKPKLLAFWSIHRTPPALAATRAVGALGLVVIAIVLIVHFISRAA